jgi:ubiquinone/menaquinone biosynthesis C-methylase UbiE
MWQRQAIDQSGSRLCGVACSSGDSHIPWVARRNAPKVARQIGYANVEFRRGKIQDLALDQEKLEEWLKQHPIQTADDLVLLDATTEQMRRTEPLVPDESIDVAISSCVLNLVRSQDKPRLFKEISRVLRRGGRAVIADIVCDEDVPSHMQSDPELWTGCISGAFRDDLFLKALEESGLYGITILARQEEPWRTVEGIEFRSTVPCFSSPGS